MSSQFDRNRANADEIAAHLLRCDDQFTPPLSSRVNILDYAEKLATRSERLELFNNDALVAMVAMYLSSDNAFISNVSVESAFYRQGIARKLVREAVSLAFRAGASSVQLETGIDNVPAINLYLSLGFRKQRTEGNSQHLALHSGDPVTNSRDYNKETVDNSERKYAYGFDFDVMHPFMVRSFLPFMRAGKLLELGSYEGALTNRLVQHCDDMTCVEASSEAAAIAMQKLGVGVRIINDRFETVTLDDKYDTIVMTHVLEHLDDPVAVLSRVNDEWLADSGRFLLACPNANAPSRQIAVKMGLISHNAAVTPGEHEHGHRITYSLDTLERDARAAGLDVIHRGGIFFKALANFQWDRLLQTDIISADYLEGCYMLGQQYPDLCSSIFIVCEKGGKKL